MLVASHFTILKYWLIEFFFLSSFCRKKKSVEKILKNLKFKTTKLDSVIIVAVLFMRCRRRLIFVTLYTKSGDQVYCLWFFQMRSFFFIIPRSFVKLNIYDVILKGVVGKFCGCFVVSSATYEFGVCNSESCHVFWAAESRRRLVFSLRSKHGGPIVREHGSFQAYQWRPRI